MVIRNKTLYGKITTLTQKVADFLSTLTKEQIPTYAKTIYNFKENGFEAHKESRPSYGWLLLNLREKMSESSEVKKCAEYMAKNPTIRKTLNRQHEDGNPVKELKPIFIYDFILSRFLTRYFDSVGSFIFDQHAFDTVYFELENYYYGKVIEGSKYSPLENFCCDEEIVLEKNLRIRKITNSDKIEYLELQRCGVWNPSILGHGADFTNMVELTYRLRRRVTSDKATKHLFRNDFEDVITALRLFKHGSISLNLISGKSNLWVPNSIKGYDDSQMEYKLSHGPKYVLSQSEIAEYKDVFRKYRKFQTKNRVAPVNYLNIAIRRFNLGVEEIDIEDKMIDFLISFEAMFLQGGPELKFRLSNRVAVLLGRTMDERETIKEIMEEAYDLRSGIVHGEALRPIKIHGSNVPPREFTARIEEILRKSIRSFINLNKSPESREAIIKDLDKSLLSEKIMREIQRKAR